MEPEIVSSVATSSAFAGTADIRSQALPDSGGKLRFRPISFSFWTTIRAPDFPVTQAFKVEQAQFELQLKVWKELAISNQMLIRGAAEALKLDPNCSQEELKKALESTLKKIAEADANVAKAQDDVRRANTDAEKKVTAALQAQTAAEAAMAKMQAAQEKAAPQLAAERAGYGKDIQQLKERLADKEKSLKAINTALADTPENVLKKMKALKKEKQDEADARREVENSLNALRKEKQQQDKQLTELRENVGKLVTQHKDLHALAVKLHEQLKTSATDASSVAAVPELDAKLLEGIEQTDTKSKK